MRHRPVELSEEHFGQRNQREGIVLEIDGERSFLGQKQKFACEDRFWESSIDKITIRSPAVHIVCIQGMN